MNDIFNRMLELSKLFGSFDEVYLFGSSLNTDFPGDIDILLIYSNGKELTEIIEQKQDIADALSVEFEGMIVDCTTLSNSELDETKILNRIVSKRIK